MKIQDEPRVYVVPKQREVLKKQKHRGRSKEHRSQTKIEPDGLS